MTKFEEPGDSAKEDSRLSGGVGLVKIQRSFTRDRFDNDREARREKEWASREERRVRIWRRESFANVSSWNPVGNPFRRWKWDNSGAYNDSLSV